MRIVRVERVVRSRHLESAWRSAHFVLGGDRSKSLSGAIDAILIGETIGDIAVRSKICWPASNRVNLTMARARGIVQHEYFIHSYACMSLGTVRACIEQDIARIEVLQERISHLSMPIIYND